jgi:hypothetical protein
MFLLVGISGGFVWLVAFISAAISRAVVKDVKEDYLGEEDDESEPEPEPYHRGHLGEHEAHLRVTLSGG